MATWLTCWLSSQSARVSKPTVVVAKVRTCLVTCPLRKVIIRQPTTVFLCTSKPAQRSYKTCIPFCLPFCYTREGYSEGSQRCVKDTRFLSVLAGIPPWRHSILLDAPGSA